MLQTIQDVVAQPSTTFADLFFSNNQSPWELVAFSIAAAVVGMLTHWFKVAVKEHTDVTLVEWFFILNKMGTVWAVLSMLGALFVAFAPLDYTTITTYQAVSQAWAIGYAADSLFNSQSSKEQAKADRANLGADDWATESPAVEKTKPQGKKQRPF